MGKFIGEILGFSFNAWNAKIFITVSFGAERR